MKKTKRTMLQLMMIVIFLAFITVPFLQADFEGGAVSTIENRYLAKFPVLFADHQLNWQEGKLLSQIEDWINDNVAFRKTAKLMDSYFQVHMLKTPVYDQILFHDDAVLLWRYQTPSWVLHEKGMDEITLQQETAVLQQVNEEMKARGIAFSMTHLMSKMQAAPGIYLPNTLLRSAETTYNPNSKKLSDYYRDHVPGLVITSNFDTMDALNQKEGTPGHHPGYFTGYDASHWNEHGAFLGYLEQMRAINSTYPGIKTFSVDDYDIQKKDYYQSWYGKLYAEQSFDFTLKHERKAIKDNSMLATLGLTDLFNGWQSNCYYSVPGSTAPKALIIGDSYLWMFMLDDIAESFSETLYVNNENAGQLWRLVDTFHPDVVSYCSIMINQIPSQLNHQ